MKKRRPEEEEEEEGQRRGERRGKEIKAVNLHQFVVDSEERHLTGFVEQVCKGDEGLGLL